MRKLTKSDLATWLRRLARRFDPPGRTVNRDGTPTLPVFESPSGQVHLVQHPLDPDKLQLVVSEYGRQPLAVDVSTPELIALVVGVLKWYGGGECV